MSKDIEIGDYVVITDSNAFSISETNQSTSHLTYEDINNDYMIGPFKPAIKCDKCGGDIIEVTELEITALVILLQ